MAMAHIAAESRALANAKDLYNEVKALIDEGETAVTARHVDNLLVMARLSTAIAQAEALQSLAGALERLSLPAVVVTATESARV